jgi:multidrug efflux system membrane fusion protein
MNPNTTNPNRRRWWFYAALVFTAGLLTYFLFPRVTAGQSAPAADGKSSGKGSSAKGGGKGGKGAAARVTPVSAATVRRGNLNIFVIGLGNVTAYNTVSIRARVDGQIMKVYFREGQMVHAGEPLIDIDPRPYQVQLTTAEGTMAKDQANLDNARLDLVRYQNLIQQGAVTKQQLDTQAATVKQDEGVVKSDQGAIDNAKLQLVYSHITAPLSGRIGLRGVDPGNLVQAASTTALATITQLQPIAVLFNMPEDNLPEVQKAMRGKGVLAAEAWDRNLQNRIASGRLLTLDNQIDQTTGTVRVKLEFANRDNTLFPNQFVNAKLLVDIKKNVVILPNTGIQRSPTQTFAYVIKPDNTVEVRNIQTGSSENDQIEIVKGLNPGEHVVTEGADKLQQGMKVAVHAPGKAVDSSQSDMSGKGPTS